MTKTLIHGFKTLYEDNAKPGIDYLKNDLDNEEAKVFFNQARSRGKAKFEDDDDRQFTLFRNSDGTYTLERR